MTTSTTYLGLTLAHPFIVGASPLSAHLDSVKRIEDAGAAAIVMHSLFEEQITLAETGRIHHRDPLDIEFAAALAPYPPPADYPYAPQEYLEYLQRVKKTVGIPVIVVSASADEHERIECLTRGAREHISKSFEFRKVLAIIRRVLRET